MSRFFLESAILVLMNKRLGSTTSDEKTRDNLPELRNQGLGFTGRSSRCMHRKLILLIGNPCLIINLNKSNERI